jgi:hypothetical protein
MTVDRLTASLADRYRFERELAITVLDPELPAVLGAVATAVILLYIDCYHLRVMPDAYRTDQRPH